MNKSQKVLFFAIGAILGVMMVAHLLKGRAEKKQVSDAFAEKRIIPGMLLDYAQEGRPVYDEEGKGVLESRITRATEPGFAQTRFVLVGGRRREDAMGRELPADFLTLTESYAETGPLTPKTPVKRMAFAYADRLRVVVKAPADTGAVYQKLKDKGAHLTPEAGSRTTVTVRFDRPTLDTVPAALAALAGAPEVVSAETLRLDWEKEIAR